MTSASGSSTTIEHLHESNSRSLEDETEEETYDNHLADSATATLNREIDYTLEENSEHVLTAIDGALDRIDDGTFGTCARCGKPIAEERLEAIPYATGASTASASPRGASQPVFEADRRSRRFGHGRARADLHGGAVAVGGAFHWLALIAVAFAAVVADQLTKLLVVSQLELGESITLAGRLQIHHVRNPGIAFGFFSGWARQSRS